jgi:hypothetical protein
MHSSLRRQLDEIRQDLQQQTPRILAAVCRGDEVLEILRDNSGFQEVSGLTRGDLPAGCDIVERIMEPMVVLGCVGTHGRAAITVIYGVDLDVVLGNKPGLTREEARRACGQSRDGSAEEIES